MSNKPCEEWGHYYWCPKKKEHLCSRIKGTHLSCISERIFGDETSFPEETCGKEGRFFKIREED